MRDNCTPEFDELWLASPGLYGIDANHFEPYVRGRRSMAVMCHHCDIHSIDWQDYVSGIAVFCQLFDYPHNTKRFRTALATRLLSGGATFVRITTWTLAFNDFHITGHFRFRPERGSHGGE